MTADLDADRRWTVTLTCATRTPIASPVVADLTDALLDRASVTVATAVGSDRLTVDVTAMTAHDAASAVRYATEVLDHAAHAAGQARLWRIVAAHAALDTETAVIYA